VAEITALIIGGLWAYSRFFATEAPSLEERGSIESTLAWSQEDSDRCMATLGITVKNIGKRPFEIDAVSLNVWLVERPKAWTDISRLDPAQLMSSAPTKHFDVTDRSILGHYAPDIALHDDYVFLVPFNDQNKDKFALFGFSAKAHATGDAKVIVPLDEYRWSRNCEKPESVADK
jgi:hypothetical protein